MIEEISEDQPAPNTTGRLVLRVSLKVGEAPLRVLNLFADPGDTVANLTEFCGEEFLLMNPRFAVWLGEGQDGGQLNPGDGLQAGAYRVVVTEGPWANVAHDAGGGVGGGQGGPPAVLEFTVTVPEVGVLHLLCDAGGTVADLVTFVVALTNATAETVVVLLDEDEVHDGEALVDGAAYVVEHAKVTDSEERAQTRRAAAVAVAAGVVFPAAVEDVLANVPYVNQDSEELAELEGDAGPFFYVGGGLAYTYNLVTCTALTMYSPDTGISLLHHVDAGTPGYRIRDNHAAFQQAVREAGTEAMLANVVTRIFTRADERRHSSSFISVMIALAVALTRAEITEVRSTDLIVVGLGQTTGLVENDDPLLHPKFALRAYLTGAADAVVFNRPLTDYLAKEWEFVLYDENQDVRPLLAAALDLALLTKDLTLAGHFGTGIRGVRLRQPG